MARLREFESVRKCLVWDHSEEFTPLKKCCRYDTPPSTPPRKGFEGLCVLNFGYVRGDLSLFTQLLSPLCLTLHSPQGTSKWSLSEKFRHWKLVLGRTLLLGTASQFVIRKHERFSQKVICHICKFFWRQSFRNALRKLNFQLKVKVFES